MNCIKFSLLAIALSTLTNCACSYDAINPQRLRYNSSEENSGITFDYKYDLLSRKYKKKERKNNIKLIAVKVTNNTENDVVFGKDIKITYKNDSELYLIGREQLFAELKQRPARYLWYLLLTILRFDQQDSQGRVTKSTPIGYVIGPVVTGANVLMAATANEKFKTELEIYDINGKTIKPGKTRYGIIGISGVGYDALKLTTQLD